MSASITLLILSSVLFSLGIYLMMQRNLTRILLGFLLVGNGVNIFIFLMSARPGAAPITGADGDSTGLTDPVPQAFILTAIVINFGITAFLLALIYRSWWLAQLGEDGDIVVSDIEDDDEDSAQVFEQSHDEDDAIQDALDASDDEDDAHNLSRDTSRTDNPSRDNPSRNKNSNSQKGVRP